MTSNLNMIRIDSNKTKLKRQYPRDNMKVYTVKEISRDCKLSETYIREEIKAKRLKAAYFGRRAGFRIDEVDLQAWLDSKKIITRGK